VASKPSALSEVSASKSRRGGEREADHRENRKDLGLIGAQPCGGGAKCEAEQSDCDEHEAQVERGEGEGGFSR